MKRRANTIVEMMITLSIFSIVSAISMNVLYNSNRAAKSIQAQVFLYTESQSLMDQMARVVERNTIDYEGYYLREVQGATGWGSSDYGYYGQAFVDPGSGGSSTVEGPFDETGYGTLCASGTGTYPDDCALPDYSSADTDVGLNPFDTATYGDYLDSNAFCFNSTDCDNLDVHVMDELMLINGDGDERIIIGRESFTNDTSGDHYISKIELTGVDSDGDGIEDEWTCNTKYNCNGGSSDLPFANDLTIHNTYETSEQMDFMPISPSSINITELYVIVTPLEDPYRAFSEPEIQNQPQITIVMTVTLSDDYGANVLGDVPSITFQRTISTGVYSEVPSYE